VGAPASDASARHDLTQRRVAVLDEGDQPGDGTRTPLPAAARDEGGDVEAGDRLAGHGS
jgi:hypothetical protein